MRQRSQTIRSPYLAVPGAGHCSGAKIAHSLSRTCQNFEETREVNGRFQEDKARSERGTRSLSVCLPRVRVVVMV